jgi:hypothetical protein
VDELDDGSADRRIACRQLLGHFRVELDYPNQKLYLSGP